MNKSLFFLILFFTSLQFGFSQNLWTSNVDRSIDFSSVTYVEDFESFDVDVTKLNNIFENAPMEFSGDVGADFSLPLPNGEIAQMRLFESPIMEAGLQAQFPGFKTFSAYDVNNHRIKVRIDWTIRGMRVYGNCLDGVFYLTPLHPNKENTTFLSFLRNDRTNVSNSDHVCKVLQNENFQEQIDQVANFRSGSVGEQLRTLRIAIAANGEYSIQHGNTVSGALAAIVTALNRINQMYENELCVRLLLVDNNHLLVYTDSDTDPYENSDLGLMLDQNVQNLNSVIGSSNYDVGHVFGSQGGGLAGLGVVCDNIKAWGATGLNPAEGEEFVEEYVAHELGHQFAANHSWNSCDGQQNNGNNSTGYEPGSGTTIMSYAGLCGADNVSSESDPYFNHISILEATSFMNFVENACAVNIPTGNNAPDVEAPPGGKFLPIETPFMLTAIASDEEDDDLTYCWEQFNTGPTSSLGFPIGNAPSFRSFKPNDSPTRVFPRMIDLILNQPASIRELLPDSSRDLDFAVTVRDNHPGSGGIAWDYISLEATEDAGPFLVLEPNGDDNIEWETNTYAEVKWDVADTDLSPVNCETVDIILSYNNGNMFNVILKEDTPNDGLTTVLVPDSVTVKARIMIKAHDNYFFDICDKKFTINQGPDEVSVAETLGSQIDLFPNPASENITIQFESLNGETDLELYNVQGALVANKQVSDMSVGSAQLSVSELPDGVYFLKMQIQDTVITKKLIIQ